MQRRRFLKVAGHLGAGLGIAGPLLRPEALHGLPTDSKTPQKGSDLVLSLDGEWSISKDPENAGRAQKWFQTPQSTASPTAVPSIIQEVFPAYHGVVWYWRRFTPQTNPYVDGRYLLRFNAVDYLAEVWLNGKRVGGHEGGETPFVLDVTGAIRPGQDNVLAVRVLNPGDEPIDGIVLAETPHRNKLVTYTNGALPDFGGIIESVELLLCPDVYINDLQVRSDWQTGLTNIGFSVRTTLAQGKKANVKFAITGANVAQTMLTDVIQAELTSRETVITHQVTVKDHQLWDIKNPYLYRLTVCIQSPGVDGSHQVSSNFGFRDFRVVNGYFRLNGHRIFLRSTHTGNHTPFRQNSPPPGYPDLLRRDMLYAKACGFNTVRFISGVSHPYELDVCDELGIMVYEESDASWLLKDSPQMKTRYENAVHEMILRDRNHPSLVMWGMLNETEDGPVFREAVSALPLVRSLDDTRLVLLSSGRFDGHLEIGSTSNPGSTQWEFTWGKESPEAGQIAMKYPSGIGSGDFHLYPRVPQTPEVNEMMRTLGQDSKPIFLSEYGIGSMMNVIHEARMYEEAGIRADAEDYVLVRSMADRFIGDWHRFGMDAVYPFPETLLRESQSQMARHRLLGFNLIRSNPKMCGFNLTGMLDHAYTGEGIWRFWRDWKPGAFDAMQDGWAAVRWCLFVEPTHTYAGRPIRLEAVLANEDVVPPGDYPAQFRAWSRNGVAWERQASIHIPPVSKGEDGPLAVPVLKEEVVLTGPAGAYQFVPYIPKNISPPETSWEFHLTDSASLPRVSATITAWGVPAAVSSWLSLRGVTVAPFTRAASGSREMVLVGDVSDQSQASQWKDLAARMAKGSTVLFCSPQAFKRGKEAAAWLPLANKGQVYEFVDWLYHKECVAKSHRVFEGLQAGGLLDWYYYGPMLPHYLFAGQDTPTEVIAAAFAAGYSTPGGYASGVLLGSYKFGAGQFVLNTFPILENIDKHPVADRMLLNLIQYSAGFVKSPEVALPIDFQSQLTRIGYNN